MTANSDLHDYSDRGREDLIEISPGVPTDGVRWGAILAGTFAAITVLSILGTIGIAIGFSSFDQGQDSPRNFAIGYGIWGMISAVAAFAFGGFLTARVAALRGRHNGLINGMMVAAFGLPLLMYVIGSAGTLLGHAQYNDRRGSDSGMMTNQTDNSHAITASARMSPDNSSAGSVSPSNNNTMDREQARRAAGHAAWATLFTLVLALGAASIGGFAGAKDSDHHREEARTGRHTHAQAGNVNP